MSSRASSVALVGMFVATAIVVLAACESGSDGAAPASEAGSVDIDGSTTSPGDSGTADGSVGDDSAVPPGRVVQIAVGRYHGCARRASGAVTCWGHNFFGSLGNGMQGDDMTPHLPQAVVGLNDATQISAGEGRTCAIRMGGGVSCWGSFGSISNGGTAHVAAPKPIVTDVDAGTPFLGAADLSARWYGHTCIRRANGTMTCWGNDNSFGRNGDGTFDGRSTPSVDVYGLTDAVELGKGESHVCARRATGEVVCWGMNVNGQLGTGTAGASSAVPAPVPGITDATRLGASQSATCVARASGVVNCWGAGNSGELGNGILTLNNPTPVVVTGLSDAKQLAGGANHFCALRETGAVVCWGSNIYGQIGDGTKDDRLAPVAVSGLTDAVEISAGWLFTCALRATGAVVCWGSNDRGQLGDGTKVEKLTPYELTAL